MGRSIQMTLGGIEFKTKGKAVKHVQEILNGVSLYRPLDQKDFAVVRDLLDLHPNEDQKIGCGVRSISVRPATGWSSHCFWVTRQDDTSTDFSYRSCFAGELAHKHHFVRCCRYAVRLAVINFRNDFFRQNQSPTCPYFGFLLTPDNCHVDHTPPDTFEKLVLDFCRQEGIDVKDQALCEHGVDGKTTPSFASAELHERWVGHHRRRAKLRVISEQANLTVVRQLNRAMKKTA